MVVNMQKKTCVKRISYSYCQYEFVILGVKYAYNEVPGTNNFTTFEV